MVKKEPALGFTDEQGVMSRDVIAQIAAGYSEADPNTQLRAAQFIYQDKKGRLDINKQSGLNLNVLMINEQIQVRMRQAIAAKQRSLGGVVEVETIAA